MTDNMETIDIGLFIQLDININDIEDLHKLNKEISNFNNGLLIFDLIGFNTYPVIYRKKSLSAYDLPDIINELNTNLKKEEYTLDKLTITNINSYLYLGNNILIFKMS